MANDFRNKVVSTLIDEIGHLSGGRFEHFGYVMMRGIHPANWMTRGTTVDGAPRGYTVDASASGGSLVAEMSSERGYFEDRLTKPTRDLDHAMELHPAVEHIWLLSSREATPSETTAVANLVTEFRKRHRSKTAEILDARAIAECIFDRLESERFVSDLAAYLPSLGRLADEHAFSHRIPVYGGYQSRMAAERDVTERLKVASFVVLKGISGIGKSALAAHVAETLRPRFELVIWLDAREVNDLRQLADQDVLRTGTRHNLASLVRRHECLLVLDDAQLPIEQIASFDWGASKVILTTQASSDVVAITVGDLDVVAARAVLEADVSSPCPTAVLKSGFSARLAAIRSY